MHMHGMYAELKKEEEYTGDLCTQAPTLVTHVIHDRHCRNPLSSLEFGILDDSCKHTFHAFYVPFFWRECTQDLQIKPVSARLTYIKLW